MRWDSGEGRNVAGGRKVAPLGRILKPAGTMKSNRGLILGFTENADGELGIIRHRERSPPVNQGHFDENLEDGDISGSV